MNRLLPHALGLVAALANAATAQVIHVPNPVQPGTVVQIAVENNTTGSLWLDSLVRLRPTGELISPTYDVFSDTPAPLAPGNTLTFPLAVPADASGSEALYFAPGRGAAARLDYGAMDPLLPALHVYPRRILSGFASYVAGFKGSAEDGLLILNTSAAAHVLGAGDRIRVFEPGGSVAVAEASLAGIEVPAATRAFAALPLAGLAPKPYTIEVQWADPIAGAVVRRYGIQPFQGDATRHTLPGDTLGLHFPEGRVVPQGGAIDAHVLVGMLDAGHPAAYAMLLGSAPGTLELPSGSVLPLARDSFVYQSLATGLGGVIQNGTGSFEGVGVCLCPTTYYKSGTISIHHPNQPAMSGMTLRAAVLIEVRPSGELRATQGEEIRFE